MFFLVPAPGDCHAGNDGDGVRGGMAYSGYSGGMMLHTGYVSAGTINITSGGSSVPHEISGMPTGIGGAIKFGFGRHLRVGTEGYVSTLKYGGYGSYASVGWGGVLADCIWYAGRIHPFAGATLGGGNVKNLTLSGPVGNDFVAEEGVSFRKYGFMCVTPFAGVEYAASSHMRLTFKVDWIINVSNRQPDFPGGPRIYLGFMFCRGR